jgi:hypothetical protein
MKKTMLITMLVLLGALGFLSAAQLLRSVASQSGLLSLHLAR